MKRRNIILFTTLALMTAAFLPQKAWAAPPGVKKDIVNIYFDIDLNIDDICDVEELYNRIKEKDQLDNAIDIFQLCNLECSKEGEDIIFYLNNNMYILNVISGKITEVTEKKEIAEVIEEKEKEEEEKKEEVSEVVEKEKEEEISEAVEEDTIIEEDGGVSKTYTSAKILSGTESQKISQLKKQFPSNKYWNHYKGSNHQNGFKGGKVDPCTTVESVTSSPCTGHDGPYTCNYFSYYDSDVNIIYNCKQCCGFAVLCSYKYTGQLNSIDKRKIRTDKDNIQTGDILLINTPQGHHYAFIAGVSGNNISTVEVNVGDTCQIQWLTRKKTDSIIIGYFSVYEKKINNFINMFRLYNPFSGEHFYTADSNEKNFLVKLGWNYEGVGWKAPKTSNTPVYRLYNPNAGDHHYTINKNERDALVKLGWNYEGVGWYSDDKKSIPLYRQYNPNAKSGAHNYTISKAENDYLVKIGWRYEGIAWYSVNS